MSKLPTRAVIQPVNSREFRGEENKDLNEFILSVQMNTRNKFSVGPKSRFYQSGRHIYKVGKSYEVDTTPIITTQDDTNAERVFRTLTAIRTILENNVWLNFKASY